MTTTPNSRCVGISAYFEFRRTTADDQHYTTQLLVMPETSAADKFVRTTYFYRRISTNAPRRQWRSVIAPNTVSSAMAIPSAGTSDPAVVLDSAALLLTSSIKPILEQMLRNNYKAVGDPVFVETSEADALCASTHKVPYQLLNRVWKARKAMKYPAEFIGPLPDLRF